VVVALRALVERHRLGACALRCFDLLATHHTTGCLALSQLLDDGVVAGCEGDIAATVSMMWLAALTGELPFMANPQDVSVALRTIWLAHCTIARGLASRYRLRSHFESSIGVGIEAELAAKTATLARVGGAALDEVTVVEGDVRDAASSPLRCRTQLALRLGAGAEGWLERLLTAPLGNHLVLVPGRHAELVREYVRLEPALGLDK
jgi:L-fucose isomerase-like protein